MDKTCTQPSIQLKELERQIDEFLETLELPEDYAIWVMKKLRKENEEEAHTRLAMDTSLTTARIAVTKKLDNLLDKYLSENNSNGEIISEQQYLSLKKKFEEEKKRLEEQIVKYPIV